MIPIFRAGWLACVLAVAACLAPASPARASWQGAPARQVVVFGVLATPDGSAMDPKISPAVQAQLRRALPRHGFKLIKVKSERAMSGQSVACDLGEGFVTTTQLLSPLDPNGKVQMRFDLSLSGISQFQTIVVTPPDQFNYFDKSLPNGNHLLLGVGAR